MEKSLNETVDITADRLLDTAHVLEMIGCNMATLRKQIKLGNFPEPIVIAGQRRWLASTINQHVINANPHLGARAEIIGMIDKALDNQAGVA